MATVLVVDDAAFMRAMLKDIIEEASHKVVGEASNGVDAVTLYFTLKPDLVTLDMIMPQQSGVDTLKEIRSTDPKARIIMVTSVDQQEITQRALALGAKGYIHKPFRPDQVKECIQKALSS
jgi:two-component system chemotaxis response regulator CheY